MSIGDNAKGFHDVTIVASNVDELRRFYGELGFRQVVDRGNDLAVFLVGANELAIHTSPTRPTKALVLSVLVDDLEPIQRQAAELRDPIRRSRTNATWTNWNRTARSQRKQN